MLKEDRLRRREEERRYRLQKEAEFARLNGGDALDNHGAPNGPAVVDYSRQPQQRPQYPQHRQPPYQQQRQQAQYQQPPPPQYNMVAQLFPAARTEAAQVVNGPYKPLGFGQQFQQQQQVGRPIGERDQQVEALTGQLSLAHAEVHRLRAQVSKMRTALTAVGQWAAQAEAAE